jgi:hypothetical protein
MFNFRILPLLLLSIASADYLVDDFERTNAPLPWTFYNGAEFPGATGSLTSGPGRDGKGKGAHLAFDMSGGGNYVSAELSLSQIQRGRKGLYLWTRAPAGVGIRLRITDTTDQTLQIQLSRPLTAPDPTQWFRVTALFSPQAEEHWGGANDGIVHGGVKAISVLAEPEKTGAGQVFYAPSGAIDFDEVTLIDSLAETLDPLAPTAALPALTGLASTLGANIHFTKDNRALDSLASAGFTLVRMDLDWAGVERSKGVYDFLEYDSLIAQLRARGMKAHFIFDYGNTLYPGVTAANAGAIKGFCDFIKASVAHFGGNVMSYEIWNEPNITTFWPPAPDAAAYATLAKNAIAAVHAANANAIVSTGGLSGVDLTFLKGYLDAGGGLGADAIGVHPYRQGSPETVFEDILFMREIVGKQFPSAAPPLWQTEWGYSSAWYGDGASPEARRQQAKLVTRELLTSWILGFPLQIHYDVRDDGIDAGDPEHNFGLLSNDYQDKPAMVAVHTLTAQIKAHSLVGIFPAKLSSLHCLKLQGTSDVLFIVWVDKGASWNDSGTMVPVEVVFPQKPALITDFLGNPLRIPSLRGSVYPLMVGDEVVYVSFPATSSTRSFPGAAQVPRSSVERITLHLHRTRSGSAREYGGNPAISEQSFDVKGARLTGETDRANSLNGASGIIVRKRK